MKILVAITVLFFSSCSAYGQSDAERVQVNGSRSSSPHSQTYEGYVEEFKKSVGSKFSQDDLNQVFRDYSGLLMTGVDTNQLANAIEGRKTTYFALSGLKTESFYADDIKTLLHSTNLYQRIMGYITLASAGDSSFNEILLKAAKKESMKGAKLWAGLALLYLQDSHTSDLFDFLVENEELGDAHMMPFYLRLDKQSLQRTAYEKIDLKDPKAKIFAVQSLSITGLNPKTEQVVRNALKTWDPSIRGYAIYTAKALGMGDLKEFLTPLPKDEPSRVISLEALANSPTQADQDYLLSLIPADAAIPNDVLGAYLKSTREESVRKWLTLVRDGKVDPKYVFFANDQPMLSSDTILGAVKDTIRQTKNHSILRELPRALSGRKDDDSINLLIQLLSDSDRLVRYWAAFSLKGNSSQQLISKLPELIRNAELRTVGLTELAIQNNIDGLQDVYESILDGDKANSTEWYQSSLQYLAAFPRDKDKALFKSILQSHQDSFVKRFAVTGLGQLRDESSVPLIADALHQEPPNDLNAISYVIALGKIKCVQSKQIIESYRNSKNEQVRNLVAKILYNW